MGQYLHGFRKELPENPFRVLHTSYLQRMQVAEGIELVLRDATGIVQAPQLFIPFRIDGEVFIEGREIPFVAQQVIHLVIRFATIGGKVVKRIVEVYEQGFVLQNV